MNLYLGIRKLGSLLISSRPSIIGSLDISLFLVVVGRLPLTTFGVMFLGYCIDGGPQNLVLFFFFFREKSFDDFLLYIFFTNKYIFIEFIQIDE